MFLKVSFLIILIFQTINCADILGVFPTPSISHQAVFQPIWRELSLRGHKVTVITPDPLNDPSLTNLTEIDVHHTYGLNKDIQKTITKDVLPDEVMNFVLNYYFPNVFEEQMKHPEVTKLLNDKNVRFDLVLTEMLFPPAYAFSTKFQCPHVGLLSVPEIIHASWAVGNPVHPFLLIDSMVVNDRSNSFFQRLWSTYTFLRYMIRYYYEMLPQMDKFTRKFFGNEIPYLGDIEKNVSLILTTSNFLVSKPKPKVPALIEIGNVHLKKNVKLPEDLQNELDRESKGMIYFSLGSNVKSANISENLRNTIISAFSEIPYKILWKWETDHLPGKPDNVITRKWLPQEAVLAHPNVKVFITQGGLQSTEEAIYYRKPMVGIPFFGDQMSNVRSIKEYGIGVEIDYITVTKDELKEAILEVFHNKTYHEKISSLADVIWDQPMSGLDTAVWWIEYVIRHKGAKNLRSPLLDMPFYQYLLLDVVAFVVGVIIICTSFLYITYKYLKSLLVVSKTQKKKTS